MTGLTIERMRRQAVIVLTVGIAWTLAASFGQPLALGTAALTTAAIFQTIIDIAPAVALVVVGLDMARTAWRRRDDAATLLELGLDLEHRTAATAAAGQAVRDGLVDIDSTLAAIGGRLDGLRRALHDDLPRLSESARQLDSSTVALSHAATVAADAAGEVAAALPATQHQADALAVALGKTGSATARQLEDVAVMLATVATRHEATLAQMTAIEAAVAAAGTTLDGHAAGLATTVDGALDRTAGALTAVRDGVEAQARTMLASIDAARAGLDAIGGPAAATVAARIDGIVASTQALGDSLTDHDTRTTTLVTTMERSFIVLDKRLAHAAAMGAATLDDWQGRMGAVRDLADAIHPPLETATLRLAAVEAAAARIGPLAATTSDLAQALAGTAGPATALATDLAAARADLTAIEEAAHGSALAAATQLIEALGRVRGIADASAGRLREALAAVVADAEVALTDAGARTAAAAFADPIRHEIAGLEGAAAMAGEAAQATADRIAARLLGLTATVATVERRLAGGGAVTVDHP